MRFIAAILICILSIPASANESDGDVNALLEASNGMDPTARLYARIHADLIARGIWTAQAMYGIRLNQPQLYCQPLALTLTGEQVIDMLRRAVQKDPAIGKLDTGLGIFRALEDAFPCEK